MKASVLLLLILFSGKHLRPVFNTRSIAEPYVFGKQAYRQQGADNRPLAGLPVTGTSVRVGGEPIHSSQYHHCLCYLININQAKLFSSACNFPACQCLLAPALSVRS